MGFLMQIYMEVWKDIPDEENMMHKYTEYKKYMKNLGHRILLALRREEG